MNYPKIESKEYLARVEALRRQMAKDGVDIVVGFSNLLEIAIVRYYCGFAPVNESAAIVIPAEGEVVVCSGQASFDFCEVENKLPGSRIAILPEIGEVSGFEYDTEGQLDFEELFKQIKAEHPGAKKVAFIGRLIFPSIIMSKLRKVFSDAEIVD
ncbi:MAG: aminopeptidase P family N-terminal domain-containing protein, partial [Oscillospiraceae bacterium]|nr:aminopeptidase P family N-terminal domain-containing protein [Oscillospiraceae bacterium]